MLSEILFSIIIGPLKLFFEIIFAIAYRITNNPGLSIIALSLTVNLLALPLYMRADKMQKEQRKKQDLMSPSVKHIKQVFKGDEKMMILQSYYRHVGYKPTDSLRGSVSLLLQIPFFTAAYQFLSNLILLQGVSFGPIRDLGKPDGLIVINGIAINLLPILMTFLNLVSVMILTKGQPVKSKIQLFLIAGVFLILLYPSPSGLAFYWTLNNAFSLAKTLLYKLKNPHRVISVALGLAGILLTVFGLFIYSGGTLAVRKKILITFIGIICIVLAPVFLSPKRKTINLLPSLEGTTTNGILREGVFLALLTGCLIPSALIAASPQEFMDISNLMNPIQYIIHTAALGAGLFILWAGIFYWITADTKKYIFELIMWSLCGICIVNYMFFGTDLGDISESLRYDNGL